MNKSFKTKATAGGDKPERGPTPITAKKMAKGGGKGRGTAPATAKGFPGFPGVTSGPNHFPKKGVPTKVGTTRGGNREGPRSSLRIKSHGRLSEFLQRRKGAPKDRDRGSAGESAYECTAKGLNSSLTRDLKEREYPVFPAKTRRGDGPKKGVETSTRGLRRGARGGSAG